MDMTVEEKKAHDEAEKKTIEAVFFVIFAVVQVIGMVVIGMSAFLNWSMVGFFVGAFLCIYGRLLQMGNK